MTCQRIFLIFLEKTLDVFAETRYNIPVMKETLLKVLVELMNKVAETAEGYSVRWFGHEVEEWYHDTVSHHRQEFEKGKLLLDGHWFSIKNVKSVKVDAEERCFSAELVMNNGKKYVIGGSATK